MNNDKRSRSVQNIVIPDNMKQQNEDFSQILNNDFSKINDSNLLNTNQRSSNNLLPPNLNSQPHLTSMTNIMSSQMSESRYSHQDTKYFPPKRKHFVARKPSIQNFPKRKSYLQRYKESFYHDNTKSNFFEIISGISIALTSIPEGVAISLLAGVPPMTGLQATFIFSIVTSLMGGRPGMISGASPALAVVQKPIIADKGPNFLYWCMIVCGIIQIVIGVSQGTKLVRFISEPVLIGFLNALAVIIIKKQIIQFREPCAAKYAYECDYVSGTPLLYMILIMSGVALSIILLPLIPKVGHIVPWEILALLVSILVNHYAAGTKTLGDTTTIENSFPLFYFPYIENFKFQDFIDLIKLSVQIAVVGLLESLMTAQIISALLKKKAVLKFEAISQGTANFFCGWTKSLGGSGLLGQSKINIEQGGTKRLSCFIGAIVILFSLLFGAKLIELTPIASLVGFMVVIGYKTFFWKTFIYFRRMRVEELFIIFLIVGVAIYIDLAVAVLIGIVFQAFMYVWWKAFDLYSKTEVEVLEDGSSQKIYYFKGELFFSSVKSLLKRFRYKLDPDRVIIDATEMQILDFSACEALSKVQRNYHTLKKQLIIINLDRQSAIQIRKSKLLKKNTYFTSQLIQKFLIILIIKFFILQQYFKFII